MKAVRISGKFLRPRFIIRTDLIIKFFENVNRTKLIDHSWRLNKPIPLNNYLLSTEWKRYLKVNIWAQIDDCAFISGNGMSRTTKCECNTNDRTNQHRISRNFYGKEKWLISSRNSGKRRKFHLNSEKMYWNSILHWRSDFRRIAHSREFYECSCRSCNKMMRVIHQMIELTPNEKNGFKQFQQKSAMEYLKLEQKFKDSDRLFPSLH